MLQTPYATEPLRPAHCIATPPTHAAAAAAPAVCVDTVTGPRTSIMNNAASPLRRDAAMQLLRARALAFVLLLNACYTWRPVELTPTRSFGDKEHVRIVRSDGSRITLVSPRIIDDSLVSQRPGTVTPIAIPTANIQRAEARRLSKGRTALLVVGVGVAVFLAVGALAASQMEFGLP